MNELVIDIHDLARLGESTELGAATALRGIAHDMHELVNRVRRLLPSSIDSAFNDLID